jgi:hypothetical protein
MTLLSLLRETTAWLPLAVVIRLLTLRSKTRAYRWFMVMLLAGWVRDVVGLRVPVDSLGFDRLFAWTAPLIVIAESATALAAYITLAKLYRGIGIGHFGRKLCIASFGLAALFCCISLVWVWHTVCCYPSTVLWGMMIYDVGCCTLAGFLFGLVGFFSLLARPADQMPANTKWHIRLLGGYFLIQTLEVLLVTLLSTEVYQVVDGGVCILLDAIYLTWAVRLTQAGETVTWWPRPEADLRRQISETNSCALDAARALCDAGGHEVGASLARATGRPSCLE